MKKLLLVVIVFLLIFLLNNCARTTLLNTRNYYRPVSPPKSRIFCDYTLPEDKPSPIIPIKLLKEDLMERVQADSYKTSYEWRNRLFFLIPGIFSIFASIKWCPTKEITKEGDTLYPRASGIILGSIFSLLGLVGDDFPWSPRKWRKEEVFNNDTHYQFSSFLSNTFVQISSPEGEKQTIKSNGEGVIMISLRDFYIHSPPDSDLILTIIAPNNLRSRIQIPNSYIKKIRKYENEAKELFNQAQSEEINKKYSDALFYYNKILSEYSNAKVAPEAEKRKKELEKRIQEAAITHIRNQLRMVSKEKVRNAIIALGLDEYEAEEFGITIENLSSPLVIAVIKNGLGMPLDDVECLQEYRGLSKFQKFYAILCYKDYLGEKAFEEFLSIFNLSYTTIEKLVNINPKNLLSK